MLGVVTEITLFASASTGARDVVGCVCDCGESCRGGASNFCGGFLPCSLKSLITSR
jgi:hypothetical protein